MDRAYLRKKVTLLGYYCILTICLYEQTCSGEICWYTFNNTETEVNCMNTLQVNISEGTYSLVLTNFTASVVISNFTLSGPQWGHITSLNISCGPSNNPSRQLLVKEFGFSELHNLVFLRLHCDNLILEDNAFHRLNKLAVLDLSHSFNVSPQRLLLNIKHLVNLRQLLLVRTGMHARVGFDMGDEFWKFIGKSRISLLDVSGMNINSFNVTSYYRHCHHLSILRASRTHFETAHASMQHFHGCGQFHDHIAEDAIIHNIKLYCQDFRHYMDVKLAFDLKHACVFAKALYYRIEIICLLKDLALKIEGIPLKQGFQLQTPNHPNISQLSLSSNDLGTIFIRNENGPFITRSGLVSLSVTNNNIGCIVPGVISHITTLVNLDLSNNNLQNMNKRHTMLFENMLSTYSKLRSIVFMRNYLTSIPEDMFLKNYGLEQIILADNYLSKVTFKIAHLKHLRYINLRHNCIHTLESATLQVLQSLFKAPIDTADNRPCGINVELNPLSCCDYTFITQLQKYRKSVFGFEQVTCKNEHGDKNYVVNMTIDKSCVVIEANEARDYKKIVIVTALVLLPLLMIVSAKALRHYLDMCTKNKIMREDALNDIRHGYFVFLSYSSEDDLFIDTRVMQPLKRYLLRRIKNKIEPIGTGDTMFRAGMYIHDEIISCLEQSKVMLILLTDHYCRSECCIMEFQRAIQLHKPDIFMMKDKVDKTLLTPAMRISYDTNSRVIWTKHEEEYVLKSTWDTVCDSIIELGAKPVQNHTGVANV